MRARSLVLALYCVFAGIQAMAQTGIFPEPPLTPLQGISSQALPEEQFRDFCHR